jgi:hypothetical protein
MRYSKGVSWIDDVRIPFVDEGDKQKGKIHDAGGNGEGKYNWNNVIKKSGDEYRMSQGRFPANILVSDDMLNDGVITKVQDNLKEKTKQYKGGNFGGGSVKNNFYFGDKGSNSRYYNIDKWFDKILNE